MATYRIKLPPTLAEVRAEKVAAIKAEAHRLLLLTDWYVVRHQETGESIPQAVLDYRAAVRAAAEKAEVEIAVLRTVEGVQAYRCAFPEE